jgi:hypothetical protein
MIIELAKIPAFTSNGLVKKEMLPQDLHFLKGFKPNTLTGYNTAVNKFLKYMKEAGDPIFTLPVSEDDIYGFCFWAGRDEGKANKQEI